jgi:hypothetical protein
LAVIATLSKGYDLDYIWRQVDQGAAKDAASYYIHASESGGEPPGRWWGPGARALGLEPGQVVDRKPYDLLFGERKAPDGSPLGRPPGGSRQAADIHARLLAAEPHATAERKRELRVEATRQARQSPLFFDLTLSLSKSISIFHASLGENARLARAAGDRDGDEYWTGLVAEVDAMIWHAVRAGFEYFQREAGYTRTGSHGRRVNGRESGQWHEADLVVAHWLQHTSRDGDMQLHVHSQVAHVARTVIDGKWRAPDSLGYNEHLGAVGAITAQRLEEALTRRFGVEWTARDDGHGFEIKGIGGEMMRLFSSRRQSITADLRERAERFEQRHGRAPSQVVPGRGRRGSPEDVLRHFGATDGRALGLRLLRDAVERQDGLDVEMALVLGAKFGFTVDHLDLLVQLASTGWHHKHEDVVSALGQLRSPAAVPALYHAAWWVPDYLDFDESRALAVKAIWALGGTPGPEAEQALKQLLSAEGEVVHEAARAQLARREGR